MTQKQHEGQGRAPQSDDLPSQVCQPEAQVSQSDGAPNGQAFALGAAQVDLVVAIHAYELEDLLPAGDEAWAEHVVDAEGLARRGVR